MMGSLGFESAGKHVMATATVARLESPLVTPEGVPEAPRGKQQRRQAAVPPGEHRLNEGPLVALRAEIDPDLAERPAVAERRAPWCCDMHSGYFGINGWCGAAKQGRSTLVRFWRSMACVRTSQACRAASAPLCSRRSCTKGRKRGSQQPSLSCRHHGRGGEEHIRERASAAAPLERRVRLWHERAAAKREAERRRRRCREKNAQHQPVSRSPARNHDNREAGTLRRSGAWRLRAPRSV